MINVGIIGYGKMGSIRAKAIESNGKGQVISVYDPNTSTDIDLFKRADSAEEIINNPNIHAVFICTPNYLNKQLTIQGLLANKHVFCEKPPAFNEQDIIEIREIEKASKKKLMYGFNHRHHNSVKHIKLLTDSGQYGRILWMRGRYGKSVDDNYYNNWRAIKELSGGGILIDQGIHMLDLFLFLADDFDDIYAIVSNLYWKLEVEDNAFVILKNSNTGVAASLHSTMTQWRHLFSLEVFLERGYFVLNGLRTPSGTYGDEALTIAQNRSTAPAATWEDEERISYHADTDISWISEINEFFESIELDTPVKTGNSQDALKLMRIVDRIYDFKREEVVK